MKRLYLLLVLLVLALAACGTATQQVTATSATATPSSTAYSQAASAAATADAKNNSGDNNNPYTSTPVAASPWHVTINGATTSAGGPYDLPLKAGDTYLTINFTAKNTSTSTQEMSTAWFTLRDGQGNTYDITFISGTHTADGSVLTGQQLRGDLSYEVPASLHTFTLQFDPPMDFDHSQIVQWTIKD